MGSAVGTAALLSGWGTISNAAWVSGESSASCRNSFALSGIGRMKRSHLASHWSCLTDQYLVLLYVD
jgi:hypothetical protein